MNTSGLSCYIHVADMINWAWLDISYLFYVVLVTIHVPPPTSLSDIFNYLSLTI